MPTLNGDQLETRVVRVLNEVLDADLTGRDRDQSLAEMPGLEYDSASVVEAVVAIESEFGVEVDFVEDDVRYAFRSLETITEFVTQKVADKDALLR